MKKLFLTLVAIMGATTLFAQTDILATCTQAAANAKSGNLTEAPGKALYFSHGFGITYKERTGIIPPADVDVILIAPKGSGTSLRRMFLQGRFRPRGRSGGR